MRCEGWSAYKYLCGTLCLRLLCPAVSMNGDMPHVPITSLAGIAGLTDCKYPNHTTRNSRFQQRCLWKYSFHSFFSHLDFKKDFVKALLAMN